jgi:hypothetical protein
MHTKHEHLPTNKLVLVSASGFSQSAKKKAQVLGMDLLELSQAESADWAAIATKFAAVFLQIVRYQISVSVEVDRPDGQRGFEDVPRDTPILVADAGSLPIGVIADHISQMGPVGEVALDYVKPGEEKDFWARFEPPVALRSLDSMGVERDVHSIAVGFHATGSMATVKLRSGVIGDAAVAFGVADFGTEQLHLSVVERQGNPPSISAEPWTPRAT